MLPDDTHVLNGHVEPAERRQAGAAAYMLVVKNRLLLHSAATGSSAPAVIAPTGTTSENLTIRIYANRGNALTLQGRVYYIILSCNMLSNFLWHASY